MEKRSPEADGRRRGGQTESTEGETEGGRRLPETNGNKTGTEVPTTCCIGTLRDMKNYLKNTIGNIQGLIE